MFQELDEKNFEAETSTGLKLVDFYTTWCGYCKKQNEVLSELSDNGIWIGKLDCDKNASVAKEYGIQSFPSFVLFKNGKIETKFSGYHTKQELLNELMPHIS